MQDSTDAKVIQNRSRLSATNESIGVLNIPIDSLVYDMKHLNRGKCLIFNHQTFDAHTGCRPRMGTDKDANSIIRCFNKLDFDVIQFMDASYRDIKDSLIKVSTEDHSDNDCIAVVVLTHGDEESLWARDTKYPIDSLFAHFIGSRCPTLLGKPKIFIIQACRGDRLDSGHQILGMGEDVIDGAATVYKIPSNADIVIYYSTAPGHFSFRNTENGSYFIQTLVSVLDEMFYKYRIDLLTLFTIVNQRVAFGFQSNVPNDKTFHKKKQIPCIQSQLTRLIFMAPKQTQKRSSSTQL